MNILSNLEKIKTKSKKRVGRGEGSGKSKTSGRGTKGQNARSGLSIGHPHYEGGQRAIIKRIPYRRGKGNPKISPKPIPLNVSILEILPANSKVNIDLLAKNNLVDKEEAKKFGVKILGKGNLKKTLEINLPVSKTAKMSIEKARGKVI